MTSVRARFAVTLLGSALLAFGAIAPSFESAPAGVAFPFQPLALPALALHAHGHPHCAFAPSRAQLLSGETVIRTEAQFREVWKELFRAPFDPTLADFDHDVVVLLG